MEAALPYESIAASSTCAVPAAENLWVRLSPLPTVAPPYQEDQRQLILDIRRYADAKQLPVFVIHIPTREAILYNQTTQEFFDPQKPYFPPEDPIMCLQLNVHNFVLRAERDTDGVVVNRIDI